MPGRPAMRRELPQGAAEVLVEPVVRERTHAPVAAGPRLEAARLDAVGTAQRRRRRRRPRLARRSARAGASAGASGRDRRDGSRGPEHRAHRGSAYELDRPRHLVGDRRELAPWPRWGRNMHTDRVATVDVHLGKVGEAGERATDGHLAHRATRARPADAARRRRTIRTAGHASAGWNEVASRSTIDVLPPMCTGASAWISGRPRSIVTVRLSMTVSSPVRPGAARRVLRIGEGHPGGDEARAEIPYGDQARGRLTRTVDHGAGAVPAAAAVALTDPGATRRYPGCTAGR